MKDFDKKALLDIVNTRIKSVSVSNKKITLIPNQQGH